MPCPHRVHGPRSSSTLSRPEPAATSADQDLEDAREEKKQALVAVIRGVRATIESECVPDQGAESKRPLLERDLDGGVITDNSPEWTSPRQAPTQHRRTLPQYHPHHQVSMSTATIHLPNKTECRVTSLGHLCPQPASQPSQPEPESVLALSQITSSSHPAQPATHKPPTASTDQRPAKE